MFKRFPGYILYIGLTIGFFVMGVFEIIFFMNTQGQYQSRKNDLSRQIETLNSRINTLKSLPPQISLAVKNISRALPPSNNSFEITSNIRQLAAANQITIKNLTVTSTVGGEDLPDINTIQIGFTAEGTPSGSLSFLTGVKNVAPVTQIESANLVTNLQSTVTQVTLKSFWSMFPDKLPSLSETLDPLTNEEQEKINLYSALQLSPIDESVEESPTTAPPKSFPFGAIGSN